MTVGTFPFGQPIQPVTQADRGPKRLFVLGVYASAVHARWCDAGGKQLVAALGVASEPYIFWRGDDVGKILSEIRVPSEAGSLEPAACNLNGPSGRSLDDDFLKPLRLTRENAWLCDLVPNSCMNHRQADAIERSYTPLVEKYGLPPVDWPNVPKKLTDATRREKIAAELRDSSAEVVITLGDMPLKWFGRAFGSNRLLRSYGEDSKTYGRLHDFSIEGQALKLLPLVHPRQAAGLGGHTSRWKALHEIWIRRTAPELLSTL